jgi:hypothetical protein
MDSSLAESFRISMSFDNGIRICTISTEKSGIVYEGFGLVIPAASATTTEPGWMDMGHYH